METVLVPTGNPGKLKEFVHVFSSQNKCCVGLNQAAEILGPTFEWSTPIEDRQTFVGNGCRKLSSAIPLVEKLSSHGVNSLLVDDSGLCIPRLNYYPGVHSATIGGEPRDDGKNRRVLIDILRNKLGLDDSGVEPAFFVCCLLLARQTERSSISEIKVSKNMDTLIDDLERVESSILAKLYPRVGVSQTAAYAYRCQFQGAKSFYNVDVIMGFCVGHVRTVEQWLLQGEGHGYDAMFYPRAMPERSFASIPLKEKNSMSHRSEALRALNEWEKSHIVQGEIRELF